MSLVSWSRFSDRPPVTPFIPRYLQRVSVDRETYEIPFPATSTRGFSLFRQRLESRPRPLAAFPRVRGNEPHYEIRLATAAIIILPSPRTTAAWLVYFNRTTRFSPRLNTLFALRSISAFSFPPIDHKGGYRIDATRPARFHAYIDPRFFSLFILNHHAARSVKFSE